VVAMTGISEVSVFERPRVAIVHLGEPNPMTPVMQIMLSASLERWGCEAIEATEVCVPDAIVVTSAGDDVPAMQELAIDWKINGVRMEPGTTFQFGMVNQGERPRPIFGVGSEPAGAVICLRRMVRGMLMRLSGTQASERWMTAQLASGLPANGASEFYLPVKIAIAPASKSAVAQFARITPLKWIHPGRADLFTLAGADALLVRPEHEPPLPMLTVVRVLEM
jgi:molybdopterin biosynthesis enzyme